jgi:hypothetical protein
MRRKRRIMGAREKHRYSCWEAFLGTVINMIPSRRSIGSEVGRLLEVGKALYDEWVVWTPCDCTVQHGMK